MPTQRDTNSDILRRLLALEREQDAQDVWIAAGAGAGESVNAYAGTQGTSSGSAATIPLDTLRGSSGEFSLSSDEIICATGGLYEVTLDASVGVASGAGSNEGEGWIEVDSVEADSSRLYVGVPA